MARIISISRLLNESMLAPRKRLLAGSARDQVVCLRLTHIAYVMRNSQTKPVAWVNRSIGVTEANFGINFSTVSFPALSRRPGSSSKIGGVTTFCYRKS